MKLPHIADPTSLLQRIAERDDLDYKKERNNTKKGDADLVKDISAIANAGGGVLIYGVNKQTLEGIPGGTEKAYDSNEIGNKLDKYLSPVPGISTELIEYEGKIFPFVLIASADSCPIIISTLLNDEKNAVLLRPGSIYTRQNTKTIEISTAEGMRQIIERAVEFRLSESMSLFHRAASASVVKSISVSDIESEAEDQAEKHSKILKIEPARIVTLTKTSPLNLSVAEASDVLKKFFEIHDVDYPSTMLHSKDGILNKSAIRFTHHHEYLVRCFAIMHCDGSFAWLSSLFEESMANMKGVSGTELYTNAIAVNISIPYIVAAIHHADLLLKALSQTDSWTLRVGFRNVGNRHMILDEPNVLQTRIRRNPFESNVLVERSVDQATLEKDGREIAFDILKEIMLRFHWSTSRPDRFKSTIDENFRNIHPRNH